MKQFLKTVRDILIILLLTLISMMVGGLWLESWEINKYALPLHYFFAPIIYLVIFLLGFRFFKRKLFKDTYESVSFPPIFLKRYFGYAVGLLLLCGAGILVLGGTFVFPEMDNYLFAQNLASFLGVFLISPLIEEIVFRVVILTQTAKRYGVFTGILVSSLLFGAVHLMNGSMNYSSAIQLIVGGTLMGILLSIVYVKENSVWASFVIHSLYNGIGSIIPVVVEPESDWPVQFVLKTDNAFITGGQYGIDCSLIFIIAYLIMIFAILKFVHREGLTLKKIWRSNHENNGVSL